MGLFTMAVSATVLAVVGLNQDWGADLAVGVAGLWLGVFGFGVAIAEIRRAATASEAAQAAIRKTLVAVAAGRLAVTLTQLRQIVEQVEAARTPEEARGPMNAWRILATDAQGLVRRRFGSDHPVLHTLTRSLRIVSEAKRDLYEIPNLRTGLKDCLTAMDAVSDQLGPLLEQLTPTIDEENDDGR